MSIYHVSWGRKPRRAHSAGLSQMARPIPAWFPPSWPVRSAAGRHRGLRAGSIVGLLALVALACSPGDNSALNPGTNRTGLTAAPETLRVPTSADREHRVRIPTGLSPILRVARTDSVEAIAFLRFTEIPADTAGLSGARLGLLLRGGVGSGLRVAAYEIIPDANWAWAETADSANSVYTLALSDMVRIRTEPLNVSVDAITPPADDTVFVRRVVQIDGAVLRRWRRLPAENEGIALRLSFESPDGALEFLSRQGQPDSARAANPALEYMQGDSVLAVSSPAADAFLYIDGRPLVSGTLPVLTIADWLPQQAIFRFSVLDSLRARYGSQYDRVTIQRAMLHLRAMAEPDSTDRLAAHGIRTTSGWDEAIDPETFDLIGVTDAVLVTDALTRPALALRLEAGTTVRGWVRGSREDGIVVRSTRELTARTRFSCYSREAADSLRPWLEVVYTRPPDPRWGTGGGK
jgi:hypothetical protein